MTSIVKTTNLPDDDFFLCRAFAKAISSDTFLRTIEQQLMPATEVNVLPKDDTQIMEKSSLALESIQWKVGDLCLCPYSEDSLLYRATIIDVSSSSCTVAFDDYGNEETHLLTELQMRAEEEEEQQQQLQQKLSVSVTEDDIVPTSSAAVPLPPPPPLPSFPVLDSNEENDTLSSTLMSWYLAGYHTGFYQGIKDKSN